MVNDEGLNYHTFFLLFEIHKKPFPVIFRIPVVYSHHICVILFRKEINT